MGIECKEKASVCCTVKNEYLCTSQQPASHLSHVAPAGVDCKEHLEVGQRHGVEGVDAQRLHQVRDGLEAHRHLRQAAHEAVQAQVDGCAPGDLARQLVLDDRGEERHHAGVVPQKGEWALVVRAPALVSLAPNVVVAVEASDTPGPVVVPPLRRDAPAAALVLVAHGTGHGRDEAVKMWRGGDKEESE